MAEHSLRISINWAGIRALQKSLNGIKTLLNVLDNNAEKLAFKLSLTVRQLRDMNQELKNLPGVGKSIKINFPKQGTPKTSDTKDTPFKKSRFPIVPFPSIQDRINEKKDNIKKQTAKGNVPGAVAAIGDLLANFGKTPFLRGLGKFIVMAPVLGRLFGMLAKVLGTILGIFIGILVGLKKIDQAINENIANVTKMNVMAQNNANQETTFKKLGSSLNMDPSKVANDAFQIPGGFEVFRAKLKALYSIADDFAALEFAKANNLEEYIGVRRMNPQTFNDSVNSNGLQTSGVLNTSVMKAFEANLRSSEQEFDYFKTSIINAASGLWTLTKGFIMFAHPLMIGIRIFNFFMRQGEKLKNWLSNIFGGKESEKLESAANKLDMSADKLLEASGFFARGARTVASIKGLTLTPEQSQVGLRRQLKMLGDL